MTARRPQVCARQLTAGPGSCAYWWDCCPDKVRHCFNRHVREHGTANARGNHEITLEQAEAWAAERDRALTPAATPR